MDMTAMQMTPPTALSTPSNNGNGRPPRLQAPQGGGPSTSTSCSSSNSSSSGSSALEITYSTISPKVEQAQQQQQAPAYPMHIKLNLIDQNPRPSNLMTSNGCATATCVSLGG